MLPDVVAAGRARSCAADSLTGSATLGALRTAGERAGGMTCGLPHAGTRQRTASAATHAIRIYPVTGTVVGTGVGTGAGDCDGLGLGLGLDDDGLGLDDDGLGLDDDGLGLGDGHDGPGLPESV